MEMLKLNQSSNKRKKIMNNNIVCGFESSIRQYQGMSTEKLEWFLNY
jgi:hypothetical protein